MLKNNKLISIIFAVAAIAVGLVVFESHSLSIAHSTFENYTNFRGCANVTSKSETEGTCMTHSGKSIKIVKFNGQWYLDGDLPICGIHIGSTCLFNWP